MPTGRLGRDSPCALAMPFLAVVVPPALAAVWLGLKFLQQDEALRAQREQERRQTSAQSAINALENALNEAEGRFTDREISASVMRLSVSETEVQAYPSNRVQWMPSGAAVCARPPVERSMTLKCSSIAGRGSVRSSDMRC